MMHGQENIKLFNFVLVNFYVHIKSSWNP